MQIAVLEKATACFHSGVQGQSQITFDKL